MDKEKTKDELVREIEVLERRVAELQDAAREHGKVKEELKKTKDELEVQQWGLTKTNEAVKVLYKELENKNKELQKLDRLKSDFVSTVSHELRTPLTAIKEAVSQVLDGILGEITPRQKEFLSVSLEDVGRLQRIINSLLDISRLEAGKVKIQRELVDIADLAKGVVALFSPRAKGMNLEMREDLPKRAVMVYADRDRIIQVFTNLLGNALKFTAKGRVEVSVADGDKCVECAVSDTGRGISEEDLPKVFGKFQQFDRIDGPGEKGTGLGLSISKSIIDLHHGKIWVESTAGAGAKFTFTLPKYTAKELCRACVAEELKGAIVQKVPLSIVVYDVKDYEAVLARMGSEKMGAMMYNLERLIKQSLRRQGDAVIKDTQRIFVLLPEIPKENAAPVAERIQKIIDEYLSTRKEAKEIEVFYKIVSYPADGQTEKEIFLKIGVI